MTPRRRVLASGAFSCAGERKRGTATVIVAHK
jgi:hypothetical protein